MALELSQLYFLRSNRDPYASIEVGYLPQEVAAHFGCGLGIAYLSSRSLNHILDDHADINIVDLLHLPDLIQRGLWVADRANSACILYQPSGGFMRYASALKVAAGGFEPYITTFHRARERQTKAKLKRGRVLRNHL